MNRDIRWNRVGWYAVMALVGLWLMAVAK